jgi:hypothetical protein
MLKHRAWCCHSSQCSQSVSLPSPHPSTHSTCTSTFRPPGHTRSISHTVGNCAFQRDRDSLNCYRVFCAIHVLMIWYNGSWSGRDGPGRIALQDVRLCDGIATYRDGCGYGKVGGSGGNRCPVRERKSLWPYNSPPVPPGNSVEWWNGDT